MATDPLGRVPYIEHAAVLRGLPAYLVARWIQPHLRELGTLQPDARTEVVSAYQAVRAAAEAWATAERDRVSVSGRPEVAVDVPAAFSVRHRGPADPGEPRLPRLLDAQSVAGLLGITDRRVRQMAQANVIGRKVAGRWVFDREEVIALAEQRERKAS